MYCQTDYLYQMPADYHGYGGAQQLQYEANTPEQHYLQQNDASVQYSPTATDRPSPSFRIEDILVPKGGTIAGHPYGMYQNNGHFGQYTNGSLQNGYLLEKEYQGTYSLLFSLYRYLFIKGRKTEITLTLRTLILLHDNLRK